MLRGSASLAQFEMFVKLVLLLIINLVTDDIPLTFLATSRLGLISGYISHLFLVSSGAESQAGS